MTPKLHAPLTEDFPHRALCGDYSVFDGIRVLTAKPGESINCPDCRTIINHIRANITEHGYRYVILERK